VTTVAYPLLEPPWGPLLGIYFILIGLVSGASLVSLWARHNADDGVRLEWILDWIGIGMLTVASTILLVDLGRPTRFFLMLTEFSNLHSPMSVGAKVVALEFFLLAISLYLLHRQRRALATGETRMAAGPTQWTFLTMRFMLGLTGFFLAVYPVVLLSRTWSSPLAKSPGSALIFLVTAAVMGTGLAWIVAASRVGGAESTVAAQLGRTLMALVCIEMILLGLEALALVNAGPRTEAAVEELTHGGGRTAFWGLVVGVGMAVPLLGMLLPRRPRAASLVRAVAAIVGAGATRYLLFAAR